MGTDNLKKIELLYLKIFKIIIIGVLSIALLTSLILLLIGANKLFTTARSPEPAQVAPKPKVDINEFLNSLTVETTPTPVKKTSRRMKKQTATISEQSLNDMVDNSIDKLWTYVDAYQKACNIPKQIDKPTFLKKFPRKMIKDWFRDFGPDFADSQDSFEKSLLSNDKTIQISKDNPKYAILMYSLIWHAGKWQQEINNAKEFERREERRVKSFEVEENARVLEARAGSLATFTSALIAFGVFMSLALLLIFSNIESNLKDINNSIGQYLGKP